jgi:hypothetical protein
MFKKNHKSRGLFLPHIDVTSAEVAAGPTRDAPVGGKLGGRLIGNGLCR